MSDAKNAQGLAGVAAHLCSAYEELVAAGYAAWSTEIRMLIEIIDAEIEWVRDREIAIAAPGADDVV